ncbi:unnamed protein product, partial [Amoebophrya sp. A120]
SYRASKSGGPGKSTACACASRVSFSSGHLLRPGRFRIPSTTLLSHLAPKPGNPGKRVPWCLDEFFLGRCGLFSKR